MTLLVLLLLLFLFLHAKAAANHANRLDMIGIKYVKESAIDIVSLYHEEFTMVKASIKKKHIKRRASLQVCVCVWYETARHVRDDTFGQQSVQQ